MARSPRSAPKKPGPYRAVAQSQQSLVYHSPPDRSSPPRPEGASPSHASSQPRLAAAKVARFRTPFFAVAGTFAFGIAFYASSLYISTSKTCTHSPKSHSLSAQKDVSSVYDNTASSFDAEVGFSEWLMGITYARRKLAKQCKGDVLEVSCGTGRNLGYYKFSSSNQGKGVTSLTMLDLSKQMIDQARLKWEILNKSKKRALGVPVRFMQGDATAQMPHPPTSATAAAAAAATVSDNGEENQVQIESKAEKKGYDTIVQTMGLCSTPSPVSLLKNLSNHLSTTNKDAKILLLEHGRSYYQWMNRILDTEAPQHAEQHGCWWNRDIGHIIQESGLEVVRERRWHLGTTWIYELRRKEKQEGETVVEQIKEAVEKVNEDAGSAKGNISSSSSSWFSFSSK